MSVDLFNLSVGFSAGVLFMMVADFLILWIINAKAKAGATRAESKHPLE